MLAAEEDFELNGRKFRAGAFIIPNADRAQLEPMLKDLGLSAWAVAVGADGARRTISTSRASATSTAGRARRTKAGCARRSTPTACRTPTSPIRSCGEANLRAKYDVIIFPHVGGTAQSQVTGIAKTGTAPLPYKKTDADAEPRRRRLRATTSAAAWASKACMKLAKFVQEGGTLITEGSTTTIFPAYALTSGVTVETPAQLFARGSILRGVGRSRRARSRTATRTPTCRSTSTRSRC